MHLGKRALYIGSSIVALSLLAILVFQFEKIGKADFQCTRFVDILSKVHCGLYSTDSSKQFHTIVGFVANKYIKNGAYFFVLKTTNSKGKEIKLPIAVTMDPLTKSITTLTPRREFNIGLKSNPSIEVSSKQFYSSLTTNSEIIVDILTPNNSQLKLARGKYGNLKIFDCMNHHKKLVDYLGNSNLFSRMNFFFNGLITNCPVSTLSFSRL